MDERDLVVLRYVRQVCDDGRAIRIRQGAGLQRSELADVAGVAESSVWRWESRKRRPRGKAGIRYGRLLLAIAPADGAGSAQARAEAS